MKVEAAPTADAARDPNHPDHARWTKDQALKRETDWLNGLGVQVSAREVEAEVLPKLQRAAARRRERKAAPPKKPQKQAGSTEAAAKLADASGAKFFKRAPVQRRQVSSFWECGKCGRCVRCKREIRMRNILVMGQAGDERLKPLEIKILQVWQRAKYGIAEYEGLDSTDVNRLLTKQIEDICDLSVPIAGAWR